ncbi:MAG TPA: hypothetical protein VKX45_01550 [Bryobacteraceae bacterium]|nr:hypothetical protein [Bryobacteraceae bacterium]
MRRVHPYLLAGFVRRYASGKDDITGYRMLTISLEQAYANADYWHAHDHAWTLGGGYEFRVGHLRFAPEIRYQRWDVPYFNPYNLASRLPLLPNQVQVLMGIGWAWRPAG